MHHGWLSANGVETPSQLVSRKEVMVQGVFALICPACGGQVEPLDADKAGCSRCPRRYVHRLGHLLVLADDPGAGPAAIDLRTRPAGAPDVDVPTSTTRSSAAR